MPASLRVFRSADGQAQYRAAYEAVLRQWPVPFEERYVPTRFGDTHVIASGPEDGPPLVLLHPSGSGATIWCRNVGPLSRAYRTYAVDTIGEVNLSVLTRPIRRRTQRRDFADWIDDLFRGLRIERAHVVGNSFGGFLALNAASERPEQVKKVVLISPAATFLRIPAWSWHFVPANLIGAVTGSEGVRLKPFAWIWQGFPIDEGMARLRAITAVEGRPRHWFPTVFRDAELRAIRSPVLLLIGDHEVIYNPERVIRRATRLVAGLKAEVVPNANHNAEYTAAGTINAAILGFLRDA